MFLKKVAIKLQPDSRYDAIRVSNNYSAAMHCDTGNQGWSCVFYAGKFTGTGFGFMITKALFTGR